MFKRETENCGENAAGFFWITPKENKDLPRTAPGTRATSPVMNREPHRILPGLSLEYRCCSLISKDQD